MSGTTVTTFPGVQQEINYVPFVMDEKVWELQFDQTVNKPFIEWHDVGETTVGHAPNFQLDRVFENIEKVTGRFKHQLALTWKKPDGDCTIECQWKKYQLEITITGKNCDYVFDKLQKAGQTVLGIGNRHVTGTANNAGLLQIDQVFDVRTNPTIKVLAIDIQKKV